MADLKSDIKSKAENALSKFLGEGAKFREGQYEAIEATLSNKRTLVVQRTGWGKSMVYFVCTKILRDDNKGLTLIISPLLSLMKNQIDSASKAGLKCEVLNSTKSEDEKDDILELMKNDKLDLVLTTPETLFTEKVQEALPQIKIGLFVIDEVHCISDWGHDFRLEYGRIRKIIGSVMKNVPILATTATANDRVVNDLKNQLGGDVFVSRGSLMRKNLSIQLLEMKDKISRYAWILENISNLHGSGIIYCLTQNDCDTLAAFLVANGINAVSYHSGLEKEINEQTELMFMNNEIKVIVATIKLGMGYDKGDISFVIHYQMPSNVVAYYQQIGRAGRNIDRAYTFLMFGAEDLDIQNYFIETAFPSEKEAKDIIQLISSSDGLGLYDILSKANYSMGKVEKTLKFLINEEFVYKEKSKYYISANKFIYNGKHYDEVKSIRYKEQKQMLDLFKTNECYNKYIVNCLDDPEPESCGVCCNCSKDNKFSSVVSESAIQKAADYLDGVFFLIEPRTRWAKTDTTKMVKIDLPNETGICLSIYGHQGYGELVKTDKYENKVFSDKLVEKSAKVLKDFILEHNITSLTFVPSLRNDMVKDFAFRLSKELGIPCFETLSKSPAKQQKEMENSSFQCSNAINSFAILDGLCLSGNILLVDDIVDSKWTITACGYLLRKAGAENVYPFALASSSKREDLK